MAVAFWGCVSNIILVVMKSTLNIIWQNLEIFQHSSGLLIGVWNFAVTFVAIVHVWRPVDYGP